MQLRPLEPTASVVEQAQRTPRQGLIDQFLQTAASGVPPPDPSSREQSAMSGRGDCRSVCSSTYALLIHPRVATSAMAGKVSFLADESGAPVSQIHEIPRAVNQTPEPPVVDDIRPGDAAGEPGAAARVKAKAMSSRRAIRIDQAELADRVRRKRGSRVSQFGFEDQYNPLMSEVEFLEVIQALREEGAQEVRLVGG